jgi:hypothetical protein
MPSKDYELFIWSCFPKDFHAAREGLVHDSLLRLEGEERQMAIDLLMGKLTGFSSWIRVEDRVVEAVGWLQLEGAIKPLQRLLRFTIRPLLRAQIGLSLYRIMGYPEGVKLAIRAFNRTLISDQYSRLICIDYLMYYAKEYKSATKRLLDAANDRDSLVAYSSIDSLKFVFAENSQITDLLKIILETLVEQKRKIPNEILTRQAALREVSNLIELEYKKR